MDNLDSRFERELKILTWLPSGKKLGADQMMDQLFISESTLKRHIRQVRNWLEKRQIHLEYQDKYYFLKGSELKIRQSLADLMFAQSYNQQLPLLNPPHLFDQKVTSFDVDYFYGLIRRIATNALSKLDYQLTENSTNALVLHVAVLVLCLQTQQYISNLSLSTDIIEKRVEFSVAEEIAQKTESIFDVEMRMQSQT